MLSNLSVGFGKIGIRTQGFDGGGYGFDDLNKFGGFRRGDPRKLKAALFHPHELHEILKKGEFTAGIVITFQVMAFTRMSPRHPDAIGTFPQSRQKKFRIHPSGAGNADHPDIGRVFHPADTGKIGGSIAAPVA
jgi:hypothetical protein